MLKFTIPVLEELGFSAEDVHVSFEMRMKCRIGTCGRCNIGNQYLCIERLVFSRAEVERLPAEY